MSNITEKTRGRDSFFRLKSESPKFKDALRKKCQQRLRENRMNFIDKCRTLSEEPVVQDSIKAIIKEDLRSIYFAPKETNVDNQLEHFEEIQNEMMDEELKWYMSEYEKILDDDNHLVDMLDEFDNVVCPICQKGALGLDCSYVVCKVCGMKILTHLQLFQIKESVMKYVDSHNNVCSSDPQFTIINELNESHLYLICHSCSTIIVLI